MAAGVDRGCSIRSLFFHQLHTVLQQECLSSLLHEEVNFEEAMLEKIRAN